MPTIACPTCGKSLNVPADLLGKKVKCSSCQGVFTAEAESAPAPAEEPARRPAPVDDEDRPRRRPRDGDDLEEERPRRRRDEDEDDDRPRRRRGGYAPHRGTLILVLGILGLLFCGIFTGIPAWIMGNNDLKEIRAGRMDPEGESLTNVGRILGMVTCILSIVSLCIGGVIFVIAMMGAAAGGRH